MNEEELDEVIQGQDAALARIRFVLAIDKVEAEPDKSRGAETRWRERNHRCVICGVTLPPEAAETSTSYCFPCSEAYRGRG